MNICITVFLGPKGIKRPRPKPFVVGPHSVRYLLVLIKQQIIKVYIRPKALEPTTRMQKYILTVAWCGVVKVSHKEILREVFPN